MESIISTIDSNNINLRNNLSSITLFIFNYKFNLIIVSLWKLIKKIIKNLFQSNRHYLVKLYYYSKYNISAYCLKRRKNSLIFYYYFSHYTPKFCKENES